MIANNKLKEVYMKRLIFVVLIVSFVLGQIFGQQLSDLKSRFGGKGEGSVMVGVIYNQGLSSINEKLTHLGYSPSLGDVLIAIGGSGYWMQGKVLIGGMGMGSIGSSSEAKINGTNLVAEMSVGLGFFEVGYFLVSENNYSFATIIGIGGGGYNLSVRSKDDVVDFNTLVSSPYSHANYVSWGGFGLELGVILSGRIKLNESFTEINNVKIKSTSTIGLNLKVSYIALLQSNDPTIIGEPQFPVHNVMASFGISFGGQGDFIINDTNN